MNWETEKTNTTTDLLTGWAMQGVVSFVQLPHLILLCIYT